MAVLPGPKTRMILDILSFILCLLVIILQLGVLDYYFIKNLESHFWYAWIAGDVLVLAVMLWLLIIAIRYNQRCMVEECTSDANIKYAFIGWFVYSMVLVGKIAVTFRIYYDQLDDPDEIFGKHLFRLTLALSAVIFLLLVEAHHYTQLNSPRQLYLTYLATNVTLDLLDSIYFLDLLWNNQKYSWNLQLVLQILILSFACINFVLPTFALLKLRFKKMPSWIILPYAKFYSLLYVLLVNLPYLTLRVYLWVILYHQQEGMNYDISVFALKNVIMIYLAIKDIWIHIHIWRQKKRLDGSKGELTAQQDEAVEA